MFDTLYHSPRVLARHRDGPASDERQRCLAYRANTGAAPTTLLLLARELLVIAQRIDLNGSKLVTHEEIRYAAEHWTRYQKQRGRIKTPKFSRYDSYKRRQAGSNFWDDWNRRLCWNPCRTLS